MALWCAGTLQSVRADGLVAAPEVDGQSYHFAFDAGPNPGSYTDPNVYQQVDLGNAASPTGGAGVVVAVLDTGATFNHPALVGHYLPGYNAIQPWLPPAEVPDGLVNNAMGHGTMIAGLIAYLAPGAQILPVRVLNGDGIGTLANVIAGIQYATSHGAQVINMSFGTLQPSQALADAIAQAQSAGALVVASAGNDGANILQYPAACDQVLAVTSVNSDDTLSPFSNYGDAISLVAPGNGIRSTYWTGGYASWSGTSFAAPFVAAEAALVISTHPRIKFHPLTNLLCHTAVSVDALNPDYESMLGAGIIDIQAAVGRPGH
jgi:subtilisin family serine protease